MPARAAISSEREKKALHIGHDIDRGIGSFAIVHHDHRHAVFGDDARHVGVALQAPDVVDDRPRPASSAQAAIDALMVSIDTGRPSVTTSGNTGASRAFSSSDDTGTAPP